MSANHGHPHAGCSHRRDVSHLSGARSNILKYHGVVRRTGGLLVALGMCVSAPDHGKGVHT